jgi:hypothetical protein
VAFLVIHCFMNDLPISPYRLLLTYVFLPEGIHLPHNVISYIIYGVALGSQVFIGVLIEHKSFIISWFWGNAGLWRVMESARVVWRIIGQQDLCLSEDVDALGKWIFLVFIAFKKLHLCLEILVHFCFDPEIIPVSFYVF